MLTKSMVFKLTCIRACITGPFWGSKHNVFENGKARKPIKPSGNRIESHCLHHIDVLPPPSPKSKCGIWETQGSCHVVSIAVAAGSPVMKLHELERCIYVQGHLSSSKVVL